MKNKLIQRRNDCEILKRVQDDAMVAAACTEDDVMRTAGHPKAAFTLAEVLITLAIIGIVAAMTIPTIVKKYRNLVVETRLKKFYTTFNDAIKYAELEYGDKRLWYSSTILANTEYDEDGNAIKGSSDVDNWFHKYLSSFLVVLKTEYRSNGNMAYYLKDGSAFWFSSTTVGSRDISFFPFGDVDKCLSTTGSMGRCRWAFNFYPNSTSDCWKYLYNRGMEPYKFCWDGTREKLLNDSTYGCNNKGNPLYCTTLIQLNNWKIPDDYPFSVKP